MLNRVTRDDSGITKKAKKSEVGDEVAALIGFKLVKATDDAKLLRVDFPY